MPTDCPIPATGECMPADRCIDFALGFALWLVIVILIHYLKRCCKVGGRMEWSFSAPAVLQGKRQDGVELLSSGCWLQLRRRQIQQLLKTKSYDYLDVYIHG
uniref:Uncharacterized protein n=1 Tax=Brassica campestris TaxID=3711 RepID=M4E7D7_BRACM